MTSKPDHAADEPTAPDGAAVPRYGIAFWTTTMVGLFVIAYGVRGLFDDRGATPPRGFAQWFVGSAIVHDALIAPAAFAVAWVTGRVLPRWAVVPVRLGLATTALLVAFAWPLVRGYGRHASNPSALPLDYGRNLVWSLVVVWLAVVAAIVRAATGAQRTRPDDRGSVPR